MRFYRNIGSEQKNPTPQHSESGNGKLDQLERAGENFSANWA